MSSTKPILSWTEPTFYSLGNDSSKWVKAVLGFTLFIGIVSAPFGLFHIGMLLVLVVALFVSPLVLLPRLHEKWPRLFPFSGAQIDLYEDRIVRLSVQRNPFFINWDNVDQCILSRGESYWVLRFVPKKSGFGQGSLRETAISNQGVLQQVTEYLSRRGVPVMKTAANA